MAKTNTLNHKKIFHLADLLDMAPWCALGLMEAFWDWAHQNVRDGNLAGYPASAIADGVKWRGRPSELLNLLRTAGFLDDLPDGVLYIHDYHDHAPEYVRKALARAGKTFANGYPAHKPKEGYAAAGYVAPTPISTPAKVETVDRQNITDEASMARQRRDNGSTKRHSKPASVEPVARQRIDNGETNRPREGCFGTSRARDTHSHSHSQGVSPGTSPGDSSQLSTSPQAGPDADRQEAGPPVESPSARGPDWAGPEPETRRAALARLGFRQSAGDEEAEAERKRQMILEQARRSKEGGNGA